MKRKKNETVTLTCESCGTKGDFPASSPAAPVLSASEASEKSGWSYSIGFFAMLTGDYHNRCSDCTKRGRAATATPSS